MPAASSRDLGRAAAATCPTAGALLAIEVISLYLFALLAKSGRAVLVLEQHYVAGGCAHEFTEKGWAFDTGTQVAGSHGCPA